MLVARLARFASASLSYFYVRLFPHEKAERARLRNFARKIGLAFSLPVFLLAGPLSAQDDIEVDDSAQSETALQRSIRLQEQILQVNDQLADLESEYGPYDRSLLEPLQQLITIYSEIGDFEEVSSILERRLQLLRTSEGPDSPNQLPLLDELIANDIRLGDWESVNDRFEYVHYLATQDTETDPETLLQTTVDKANWNFAQVYLMEPNRRVRHFQNGRELLRETFRNAEELYGEDSLELAPWLYREAVLQYQVASVLLADDELGVSALSEIYDRELRYCSRIPQTGIELTRTKRIIRNCESYLREGLGLIKRIRDMAEASGDLEAQAMAMTYEADFQMLLELGTARRAYQDAMDKFIEAGKTEEQVSEFFQRPIALPEPEFHLRMADAIRSQEENGFQWLPANGDDPAVLHLGTYRAWSESLPFAVQPPVPEAAQELESMLEIHQLELEFSLNSRGYTRNPEILDATTDAARVRRDAREALRTMQFRPWFRGSRWRSVDNVRLTYLIPAD